MGLVASTSQAGLIKQYDYQGPPVGLPDLGQASVTINVPDSGAIADLNVGILIQHTWQGDLIVELEHVDTGTIVPLLYRAGDSGGGGAGFSADNFGNPGTGEMFYLDDEAAAAYDSAIGWGGVSDPGIPNVTGAWKPYGAFPGGGIDQLTMYDGEDKAGTWILHVSDNAGGDVGSIIGFSLVFTNVPGPGALALLGLVGLMGGRRRRS